MTPDDLTPDRDLRDILRRFDSRDRATPAQRRNLKRRIEAAAAPRLAERAGGAPAWWEFAASWARTLIPLGVATALAAAALMLWTARADRARTVMTPVATQDSLVGSVRHDRTSQRLLDYLVTPARSVPATPLGRN